MNKILLHWISFQNLEWVPNIAYGLFIAMFITLVGFIIYFAFFRKKEIPVDASLSPEDELDSFEEFIAPVVSVDVDEKQFQSFFVDKDDPNLYHHKKYELLTIRLKKVFHHKNRENFDDMVFSTSFAHKFTEELKEKMLSYVPQLVSIDSESNGTHELLICKSSASNWNDLKILVLEFLFEHMEKLYDYQFEQQEVYVKPLNGKSLKFILKTETYHHINLGVSLFFIKGVDNPSSQRFPLTMDSEGNYDFNLEIAKSFTLEEVLPKVKKVFNNHFPKGVIFKCEPELLEALNG